MKNVLRILGKIFSRLVVMIVLIGIQLYWIGYAIIRLSEYAKWIQIGFDVLAVIMALFVIYRDTNPAYKIGWILLISTFPILGSCMYAIFGNKKPSKSLLKKIAPVEEAHRADLKQEYGNNEVLDDRVQTTMDYISNHGPYPSWSRTKTKYHDTGDAAFIDIMEDLKKAEHYIFMEYFIIGTGYMWDQVFEVLKQKVAEGLDVRIIYDDVGSISKVPISFNKTVEEAGIKIMNFNPLRPIVSLVYNNRDHRKILVIDGYIAYSGGYNIADEYINRVEKFGHWKDSGIRLEGNAVWNYTVMFLNMWNAFRPTDTDYGKYRPFVHHEGEFDSDGIVQPYSDSPLDDENLGENVYLELINQATEYLYIFTPYLILDNEVMTALELASKRGVDVRLVTPGIPDKAIVFRLTQSYYRPLIKAGVRVFQYSPGFIHSKCVLCDDNKGVVGTINFDYRSLFLHFECGTLMLGCNALSGLKDDCRHMFEVSQEVTMEDCRLGFFGQMVDGVLRALAPLM